MRRPAPQIDARLAWGVVLVVALALCGAAAFAPGLLFRPDVQAAEPADADGKGAEAADEEPEREEPENPFPNRSPAPGLEGGVDWLNTSGPITLKDLRGKVVLLDFWTYCCINCMHVLPDLEYLEEKYADELVVIGVHSAKFDNEKESEAIREAILRYEIAHPVINDANMLVWRKYGARAWPTLVLIDPEGNYCGYVSGEGNREILDEAIGRVVAYHEAKGTLDRTPVRFDLERFKQTPTPLRYPGKVLADAASNRLFISDGNHNRIVVTTLDGELLDVIGSGRIGRADGPYADAEFDHPQGMALDGETLYVADTENHLIRKVDLAAKRVSTLAGTGEQARFRDVGGTLRAANLNSPWDLLAHDGVLYVAMAGPHQIWSHELGSDRIAVFAGSGREDVLNGPHAEAAFAQPSGLATDGEALYVADSEGSAIRRVPFDAKEKVTTVAGTSELPHGRSLFEFGDVDGIGDKARLQHPLAVAYRDRLLYVADSYNHKLKTIRLDEEDFGTVETFLGTGEAGDSLDPVRFSEPAGLSVAGETLYVADTNNHRVLRVDLRSKRVAPLEIAGLNPPEVEKPSPSVAETGVETDPVAAERQTVRPGEVVQVTVELTLPEDYKLNPAYPLAVKIAADGPQPLVAPQSVGKKITASGDGETVRFALPLTGRPGEATLRVSLSYGYCRDGKGGLCKVRTAEWLLPLAVADGGADSVRLTAPPAEPEAGG
ncbi:MAG TPA: thioredoxin-like domain-containing protein [Planctomycetaceae bacterium]